MLVTAAYIDIASGHGSEREAVHYPRRNASARYITAAAVAKCVQ